MTDNKSILDMAWSVDDPQKATSLGYFTSDGQVWINYTESSQNNTSFNWTYTNGTGRTAETQWSNTGTLFDINYRAKLYLSHPAYIIMLILGFFAISLNVLSILALFQIRNRINTHYRLIISLAVSDTLIGITGMLYIINKVVHTSYMPGYGPWNERLKSRCLVVIIKALNLTSLNISLLNLMGMSIDHYIAITKPLRYHQLMGKDRARLMIIILWFIAFVFGFSNFFSGIPMYQKFRNSYNYCEIIWITKYQEEYSMIVIAFLCLFVMLFIYLRIYWKVKRHKAPGEIGQAYLYRKREEQRNKKALITTLLVLGSFIICWLPTCLFQIILIVVVKLGVQLQDTPHLVMFLKNADKYIFDLLLLNVICDPIIYTVRCYEVRLGYKRLFGRFFRAKTATRGRSSKRGSFKTSFMTLNNVENKTYNVTVRQQNGNTGVVTSLSSSSKEDSNNE